MDDLLFVHVLQRSGHRFHQSHGFADGKRLPGKPIRQRLTLNEGRRPSKYDHRRVPLRGYPRCEDGESERPRALRGHSASVAVSSPRGIFMATVRSN